jgi:hypothetical protein
MERQRECKPEFGRLMLQTSIGRETGLAAVQSSLNQSGQARGAVEDGVLPF